MTPARFATSELLGPLNEHERKYAPAHLFVAGHREWLSQGPKVSIVGARRASADGLRRTARLARLLVERDVIVVSGLAEGIDTAAHEATVAADGRTIAVIGTPLSEVFPAKNRQLQARLMTDHLVVSQFADGHAVLRKNFPIRNRTMALIVDASVIVEASDGSGTLSQGWEALRLGRALWIMRSVVENRSLKWPQEMLNYGASILTEPDELFDTLPPRFDDPLSAIA